MNVAVISDIHANLEALQAVLADIRALGLQTIYCLGDVAGYGADPEACLDLVRGACQICLRGNHDQALTDDAELARMNEAAAAALRLHRDLLSPATRSELAAWPLAQSGGDARLVHGSPDVPAEFHYVLSRLDVENAFHAFPEHLGFCGHTHHPLVAEEIVTGAFRTLPPGRVDLDPACRYLINVGSVGQPRDGRPEARYVVVGDQPPSLEYRFVPYDVATAQRKIRQAGLPEVLAARLAFGH